MQDAPMPAQSLDFWKNQLNDFKAKLSELTSLPIPKYSNYKLDNLHDEGLLDINNVDTQITGIKKLMSGYIDSSTLPLSQLLDLIKRKLQEEAPNTCISSDELITAINQIASRNALGISDRKKNTYEDTDPFCMWCWEVDEYPQPNCVKKERNLIGKAVRSLHKLITALEKENVNIDSIQNLHDSANKAVKAYDKLISEERERKRVRDEKENEKMMKRLKIEEKKKQVEEEKTKKQLQKEEENKKKEEEAKRKKAEKQALLEKTPEKPSQEKKAQSPPKKPPMLKMDHFFKPKKATQDVKKENRVILQKVPIENKYETIPGDFNSWLAKWKKESKTEAKKKPHFIYIQDSALKPYFEGIPKTVELRRNPFHIYTDVNYEIDSEEEYEEKFGEDIEREDDDSESDSFSESEEGDKFIVPDGYLSNDEIQEDDEAIISYKPPKEILPMKVITLTSLDSELLANLRAFNIQNVSLPVIIDVEKTPIPAVKAPKLTIDDIIEEFKTMVNGKKSKKEIVAAVIEKYPDITKVAVSKKVDELCVRTKIGNDKKKYYLKSAVEGIVDPFSILNTGITNIPTTNQPVIDAATGAKLILPFSPCQPPVNKFMKPKVTASQAGSTQN